MLLSMMAGGGGGGGGSMTQPTELNASSFWMDGRDSSLFFQGRTATSTQASTDGATVLRFDSALGKQIIFDTSNGTLRTTRVVGSVSGLRLNKPSSYFTAQVKPASPSNASTTLARPGTASAMTIIAVVSVEDAVAAAASIYSNDYIYSQGFTNMHLYKEGANVRFVHQIYTTSGTYRDVLLPAIPLGQYALVTLAHGGGTLSGRTNGGSWVNTSCSSAYGMNASQILSSSQKSHVRLAQMAIFPTRLADAEIATVEAYFASICGITI